MADLLTKNERRSNEVLEVLRATHDGDDLRPFDLKLCELAVNGHLSEKGEKAFDVVLARVREGRYDGR